MISVFTAMIIRSLADLIREMIEEKVVKLSWGFFIRTP
jgi:hypothetical protein